MSTSRDQQHEQDVEIVDQEEFDVQLGPMQELFSEAFVQLQQEITEEAARAFTAQRSDPLAILHDLNKRSRNKRVVAPVSNKRQGALDGGGFIRNVPLPERMRRTQQQQAEQQARLTKRMKKAASDVASTANLSDLSSANNVNHLDMTKRRKSSRKSIWSMVRDEATSNSHADAKKTSEAVSKMDQEPLAFTTCKSCGSGQVISIGTNTSRNQDLKKGETWGMKDRGDEVFTRLQCQSCGLVWNEES